MNRAYILQEPPPTSPSLLYKGQGVFVHHAHVNTMSYPTTPVSRTQKTVSDGSEPINEPSKGTIASCDAISVLIQQSLTSFSGGGVEVKGT